MKYKSKILPPRDSRIRRELSHSAGYASTGFSSIYSGAKTQVTKFLSKFSNICSSSIKRLFPTTETPVEQNSQDSFSLKLESISDTLNNPVGSKPLHEESLPMPPRSNLLNLLEDDRLDKKTKIFKELKVTEVKELEPGVPLWAQLKSRKSEKVNPNSTPITGKKVADDRPKVVVIGDRKCDSAKEEREKMTVDRFYNSDKSEPKTPNFADIVEKDFGDRQKGLNLFEKNMISQESGKKKEGMGLKENPDELFEDLKKLQDSREKKGFLDDKRSPSSVSASKISTPSKVSESDEKDIIKDSAKKRTSVNISFDLLENTKSLISENKEKNIEKIEKNFEQGKGKENLIGSPLGKIDSFTTNPFALINSADSENPNFRKITDSENPFKTTKSISLNPGIKNQNKPSPKNLIFNAPKNSISKSDSDPANKRPPDSSDLLGKDSSNPFIIPENPFKLKLDTRPDTENSETKGIKKKEEQKNPFLLSSVQEDSIVQAKLKEQIFSSFNSVARPVLENQVNDIALPGLPQRNRLVEQKEKTEGKESTGQIAGKRTNGEAGFSIGVIPSRTLAKGKRAEGMSLNRSR